MAEQNKRCINDNSIYEPRKEKSPQVGLSFEKPFSGCIHIYDAVDQLYLPVIILPNPPNCVQLRTLIRRVRFVWKGVEVLAKVCPRDILILTSENNISK